MFEKRSNDALANYIDHFSIQNFPCLVILAWEILKGYMGLCKSLQ